MVQSANAREVLCMVMGAFSSHPAPLVQTMLLRQLPPVLARIRRKRTELTASCLSSLHTYYLAHWRGGGLA